MPRCPDYLSTLKLAALALLACLSVVPGTLSPASAQCIAANQWAYGSCGRSGGGFSGGSGGGNNIAAGLGVAAAGAGFLGALLEAAEEHRQQEQEQQAANNAREAEAARRAHAARQAYCYENWRQAANDINAGNATLNQWNPGGAIGYYERAISLLSRCGDARNIAIARRNLEAARQKYAAVRDDNRVQDAISRYGGGNAYRVSTNPFDAAPAPATPNAATNGLRINPVDVYGQAQKRCDYANAGSPAWKSCMVAQEARLIMDADSDIKAVCGLETTGAARNDCAIRNYVQKVQRPNPSGNENCYFDERGRPCYPGGSAGARAPEQKESLRDEIRRKIAAMKEREGRPAEVSDEEVAAVEKQQAGATPEPVAQSTQDWNRDDPLQHYLHGGNRNSGGLNSGALGEAKPGFIGLTPDVAAP